MAGSGEGGYEDEVLGYQGDEEDQANRQQELGGEEALQEGDEVVQDEGFEDIEVPADANLNEVVTAKANLCRLCGRSLDTDLRSYTKTEKCLPAACSRLYNKDVKSEEDFFLHKTSFQKIEINKKSLKNSAGIVLQRLRN